MENGKVVRGIVCSGRNLAEDNILSSEKQLRVLTGEKFYPGSLNLALAMPLRLRESAASRFGIKDEMRLWRASCRGQEVFVYRWPTCPLTILEVLAPFSFREQYGLSNGDELKLTIDSSIITPIDLRSWLGWVVIWAGRSKLCYSDVYYPLTISLNKFFDFTQSGETISVTRLFSNVISSLLHK